MAQPKSSLTVKQSSGAAIVPATPTPPVPPVSPSSPRILSGQPAAGTGTTDAEGRLDALEALVNAMRAEIARSTEDVRITGGSILDLNRKTERNTADIIEILKRLETLSRDISGVRAEMLALQSSVASSAPAPVPGRLDIMPSQVEELTQQVATLRDEMEMVKRELAAMDEQLKDMDPGLPGNRNLRRILGSPYLGVTATVLSIVALILAF